MNLTVVAPTFNESVNLRHLVDAVEEALQHVDYELLIVDDDSPDLTWQHAEELASRSNRIRVLRRRSDPGLAAAVIDGFSCAKGEFVACIDADLQHDPAILPAMLNNLKEGHDLIIGSRYVAHGGIRDWNSLRRLQSWIATKLAKVCLGVEVSDPMSGFFMMRREDFLQVRDKLCPQGFKILLEILVAMQPQNLMEVPYVFGPRLAGKSKLGAGVVFSYLRQLLRLGSRRLATKFRGLKFAVVRIVGLTINL
jgi:dolichol-phosphate mannosyltransferase